MVWTNKDLNIINKGIEIALNGVIIDTKDFNWSANINFSKVDNKVENMTISKLPQDILVVRVSQELHHNTL